MGGSVFSDPWYRGSNNVFGEKEEFGMVCYDKRHLKPPGPEKVWISPPPTLRATDADRDVTAGLQVSGFPYAVTSCELSCHGQYLKHYHIIHT